MDISNSGVIGMSMTFSYGAGGLTPTAASVTAYDSAGSVSTTSSVGFDYIGNTSNMLVYDDSGILIQEIVPTLSGGKVVRQDVYDGAGNLMQYTTYLYDAANNIIRTDIYNASGVIQTSEVKTYNAAGSVLTIESYSGTTLSSRMVNTYNAFNLMTRSETYMGSTLYSYTIMDYNAAGKMTLATAYDSTDTVTGTTTYTYNAAGNPTEAHSVMSFMGMSMTMDIYYTYNAQDLPIEINATQSLSGMPMMTMRTVMTYEAY
jgi:hypothetical protein